MNREKLNNNNKKIYKNKIFKRKIKFLLNILFSKNIGDFEYLYFIWYCLNFNKLRSIKKKNLTFQGHKYISGLYKKNYFIQRQKRNIISNRTKKT